MIQSIHPRMMLAKIISLIIIGEQVGLSSCGIVSKLIASTMPTIFNEATIVMAMSVIIRYIYRRYRQVLRACKGAVESYTLNRTEETGEYGDGDTCQDAQ